MPRPRAVAASLTALPLAAAGFLALAVLVACNGRAAPGPVPPGPQPTESTAGAPPGCGKYCLQGGGDGTPPPERPLAARIAAEEISLAAGVLPVPVVCELDTTCHGVITMKAAVDGGGDVDLGRAAFTVGHNRDGTVEVRPSPGARKILGEHGRMPAIAALSIEPCPTSYRCDEQATLELTAYGN
jgi:hypothetical protein